MDKLLSFSQADHTAEIVYGAKQIRVNCSCGNSWVHPLTVTDAHMRSIFESHMRYFKNKPMETL